MIVNKIIICAFLPAAPLDACVLNHTVIGVSHAERQRSSFSLENLNNAFGALPHVFAQAGERLMVDVCTHCECMVEAGAVRKYRLSCRRISCPTCPMVTIIPFHYFLLSFYMN